jgi:hypothetical protein
MRLSSMTLIHLAKTLTDGRVTGPLIGISGRRDDSIIDSVYLDYPLEIFWRTFIMIDCLLFGERELGKG